MPAAPLRLLLCLLCLAAALPLLPAARATDLSVTVHDGEGLPLLTNAGAPALNANYTFWDAGWAWTLLDTRFETRAPFDYAVSGRNAQLGFALRTRTTRATPRELRWDIELDAQRAREGVIGGGIVFKFDLAAMEATLGRPELLPGNAGWTWGKGPRRIEMRFEPALPSIYFERGQRHEIRAFFYDKTIPAGQRQFIARLSVGEEIALTPTLNERFGGSDSRDWSAKLLDPKIPPVDLSFLNADDKPAGRRGPLRAQGEALVFADGTPARLWGTNLTSYALFGTSKEAACREAKRLSAHGFNLVRLHHHDSHWVAPNIFGDERVRNTGQLDPKALDSLDWWIKCLKDEGIYVWLDLHVGRFFKEGDRIYGFDEIKRDPNGADLKGYSYVNLTIQQAMQAFNAAYLNHRNAYTGIAYKDEPAIVALLITNENDVTHHFGNLLLPDKKVPLHNRLYMSEAESFARQHGLPRERTWRSWEAGPSKLFLNDLEQRFNVSMIAHLRRLGAKAPVATTNTWGGNPLFALPALTTGDLIDVHAYGGPGQLERNPLFAANMVHWMAAAQVVGKPLSVTEWNAEPFPTPDRHTLPLYVAAQASLQGWDALMQYAWSQTPLGDAGTPSNWHAYNDPALIATLPAAALMYRQGHVREADTTYVFAPGSERLFNEALTPDNAAALRTAAERGKLVIAMPKVKELPWLTPSPLPAGARIIHDPHESLLPAGASEARSDTGELRRDWARGIFTVDTARTQAAMGWIGGAAISLQDVLIETTTRNASVAVQSLDGQPIARSRDLLISLGARALPGPGNSMPMRAEPVVGRLTLRAQPGLKLYKRGVLHALREVPVAYADGQYQIALDPSLATYWLRLRAAQE